jgi:lipoprotein-anchoring transpeptidase ErfK/SrfK
MNAFCRPVFACLALLLGAALLALPARADSSWFSSTHTTQVQYPKDPVPRNYSMEDRVRYQLWPYTWHPDPDEPITHITINIAKQMVYVYQGDHLAASSPVTTGKPGHETPIGHFTIIKKDINHKSNLYGLITDEHGNVVDDNADTTKKLGPGQVYDQADMPYYMRLRDDGTGMHGGYLPGYPASHGCIRLPHAFAELLYSNVSLGVPVDIVAN